MYLLSQYDCLLSVWQWIKNLLFCLDIFHLLLLCNKIYKRMFYLSCSGSIKSSRMLNTKKIKNMYFQKLSKYKQMIDGKTISAHFNIQKQFFLLYKWNAVIIFIYTLQFLWVFYNPVLECYSHIILEHKLLFYCNFDDMLNRYQMQMMNNKQDYWT